MPWEQAQPVAGPLRFAIFVGEQNVPSGIELDDLDASCVHAVAYDVDGKAIGTGRLLPDGHIGRMAVLREWRGMGVGAALLHAMLQLARNKRIPEARLNAQTHAAGFYARFGFLRIGPEFLEAGIPHVEMSLRLAAAFEP